MRRTPLKSHKPLARKAPMARRWKPKATANDPQTDARKGLPKIGAAGRRIEAGLKVWRKAVRALFPDRLCQLCRTRKATHVHHPLTQGAHPELRFDPRNGCPCCPECHDLAHADEGSFVRWWAGDHPPFAELLEEAKTKHKVGATPSLEGGRSADELAASHGIDFVPAVLRGDLERRMGGQGD